MDPAPYRPAEKWTNHDVVASPWKSIRAQYQFIISKIKLLLVYNCSNLKVTRFYCDSFAEMIVIFVSIYIRSNLN
ncbi:protein of unknown function [Methylocella tundrae]|uniref:Uncharacterized protein n=1 Tax=Methylocella tundrae TaxID=227605 RepID=A0A4U8Z631_METTU|nr:protein of unknown function [Methylocella tundrae]